MRYSFYICCASRALSRLCIYLVPEFSWWALVEFGCSSSCPHFKQNNLDHKTHAACFDGRRRMYPTPPQQCVTTALLNFDNVFFDFLDFIWFSFYTAHFNVYPKRAYKQVSEFWRLQQIFFGFPRRQKIRGGWVSGVHDPGCGRIWQAPPA